MYELHHIKPVRALNPLSSAFGKMRYKIEVSDLVGKRPGWFRATLWKNKDGSNNASIEAELSRLKRAYGK